MADALIPDSVMAQLGIEVDLVDPGAVKEPVAPAPMAFGGVTLQLGLDLTGTLTMSAGGHLRSPKGGYLSTGRMVAVGDKLTALLVEIAASLAPAMEAAARAEHEPTG